MKANWKDPEKEPMPKNTPMIVRLEKPRLGITIQGAKINEGGILIIGTSFYFDMPKVIAWDYAEEN